MFNSNVSPKRRPKHERPVDWFCHCEALSDDTPTRVIHFKRNAYYLASCATCRTKRP